LANLTTLYGGGSETVSSGGTDNGAQISGGTQIDFGVASGAAVLSGRVQNVSSGGVANGTTISFGGTENVWSGGTQSGTWVSSGGTLNAGEQRHGVERRRAERLFRRRSERHRRQ
jgi:autotransporter passenger strand-loop-strand repeat protein